MNKVHDLSVALVARALDAEGWLYSETPDGGLLAVFEHGNFLVTVEGAEEEILVVTGLLDGRVDASNVADVDDIIDDFHRSQLWPTIRREPAGEGEFSLATEVAGYFPHGASCEQVRTQLRCAVGSSQALAHRLEVALGI